MANPAYRTEAEIDADIDATRVQLQRNQQAQRDAPEPLRWKYHETSRVLNLRLAALWREKRMSRW